MNGNFGGRSQEVQVVLRKDKATFNPAEVFVFVDEAEDSIDDGHFLVWPSPDTRWVNLPAARQFTLGGCCSADGHVEKWVWRWQKRFHQRWDYWKIAGSRDDLMDFRTLQPATLTRRSH